MHLTVGDARRRLERVQQAVTQVLGLVQEHLVLAQLVGRQQAAQRADGGFEERHAAWLGEAQVVNNPVAGALELLLHAHDPQHVERVQQRHAHAAPVVLGPPGTRLQLVGTPCLGLVPVPSVLHGGLHFQRTLTPKPAHRHDVVSGWPATTASHNPPSPRTDLTPRALRQTRHQRSRRPPTPSGPWWGRRHTPPAAA